MHTKVTILGSGAMATACAVVLAEHPHQEVSIWAETRPTPSRSGKIGKTGDCFRGFGSPTGCR